MITVKNKIDKLKGKRLKITPHLSRNSFVLVTRHDDNLHVVVPDHLPEVNDSVRHWTL